jgi:Ser-tRNA(Ala) deacylase AlaX
MTELLYLEDGYLREFDASVTAERGQEIVLDRTAFFPGGGGQPPDAGRLRWSGGEARVAGLKKDDDAVWHILEGLVPRMGQQVRGALDWDRRYAIMRYHSALHVLVGTVYHLHQALVTGGAIYPDRARMDFALEDLSRDRVAAIEAETNRVIREARPMLVRWMSREEFERADLVRLAKNLVPPELSRIRVIEIEGFDAQADGGTHVANTREIGRLVVTKTENKGKINRRLEIALV